MGQWLSSDAADALSTFVSTVLGALIAALVSWQLARRTSAETLRRDAEQRLEAKLGLALQAHVKLKTIIDNLGTLLRMIERALANPPSPDARPWMCVEPIIGSGDEHSVRFTAAELALFMEAQRADIAEDMQMLARKNSTAGASLETYNKRRDLMKEKMPPPESVVGNAGTTGFTREQYMAVLPDWVALDGLLEQLVTYLREDLELGLRIAEAFGPALQKHFEDKRFPGFLIAGQNEAKPRVGGASA